MTKNASKPRLALLGTAAAVLVAGAIAWVIVDRAGSSPATPASAALGTPGGKPAPKSLDKPLWRDLSPAQRTALAPLQAEWDHLEGMRKRRWLELSERFSSMSPPEQQRVHERMRQWMKLTPQQRNLARENFSKARNLAPGEKTATWESYKQLSPEQKRKLAKSAARKPSPVALPESPTLVIPTSCPPNTTRRGASCITIPTLDASGVAGAAAPAAAPASTASATPAAGAVPSTPATPPAAQPTVPQPTNASN
ncbi:DUF3106 domain-containing protein [Massilia sp. ST3]|uniref:DUF3106 domain-containing protein n=1 Tax=Massilia sp. ST3 TaxID=2824903 RepID=UPI001B83FC15|nr:DUF3106 domain-containing protein [Massilia sp. ST3]MBQ5949102.1 DUF3106 domain-containing protein [Massilia sp. ST3]